MDRIYTKRAFAFISILVLLISLATNVFAISEQGLPGEVGDMFDEGTHEARLPRAGENTTDLPDGDHTTERAPTTTRSPLSTTSPATTGNISDDVADAATSLGGAWIILLLVLLAAVIVIIVAVVTKKK